MEPNTTKTINKKHNPAGELYLQFNALRGLILCKNTCIAGDDNLFLITTINKDFHPNPTPDAAQQGWLSFTENGLLFLDEIGISLPRGNLPKDWLDCQNGNEHGNRTLPGKTYQCGFYFMNAMSALKWTVDLMISIGVKINYCSGFPGEKKYVPKKQDYKSGN